MIKNSIKVLKYFLPALLALVLMYLAFRNVDFNEFWEKARHVDYIWVFVSIALSYFAYWIRAYRWNLLLKPIGYMHLTTNRTTLAVLIGYLANLAFPRLGEVTRCGILKRNEKVPMTTSFGSVITERIIDVVSLFILILFTLLIEYDTLILFIKHTISPANNIEGLAWKAGLGLLALGIMSVLVIWIAIRSGGKFKVFIHQILEGVLSLRKVQNFPGFIFSTILLWVVYFFMSYIIVFALNETADLNWQSGVMLLVTSGIALAIPVQGGFGTYHTMVSSMLFLYGIDKTTGVFFATLLHTSQIIAIAIFGGIALLVSLIIKKKDEPNET